MSKDIVSFHGDPKMKREILRRLRGHAKRDEIIKGTYWQNGKGCHVGCVLGVEAFAPQTEYCLKLGVPGWFAKLNDTTFERLPNGEAKRFAVDVIASLQVGVKLDGVRWQYCSFVLSENLRILRELNLDYRTLHVALAKIASIKETYDFAYRSGHPPSDMQYLFGAANAAASELRTLPDKGANIASWLCRSAANSIPAELMSWTALGEDNEGKRKEVYISCANALCRILKATKPVSVPTV